MRLLYANLTKLIREFATWLPCMEGLISKSPIPPTQPADGLKDFDPAWMISKDYKLLQHSAKLKNPLYSVYRLQKDGKMDRYLDIGRADR